MLTSKSIEFQLKKKEKKRKKRKKEEKVKLKWGKGGGGVGGGGGLGQPWPEIGWETFPLERRSWPAQQQQSYFKTPLAHTLLKTVLTFGCVYFWRVGFIW